MAEPSPAPHRSATDVLAETVELTGRDVLDVGCGAGDLVRWLRSQGARATGAECGAEMRGRAVAADPDHVGDYVDAPGEALPFDAAAFDVVVYSYALHHVPVQAIPAALAEARRVLRPGGTLYVVEPEPLAPDNAAAHPVVDERVELTAAQAALDRAGDHGLTELQRFRYESTGTYPDFTAWAELIVGIDPDRAASMEAHRERVHGQFHRLGRRTADGYEFERGNIVRVFSAG